jgi:capsular polysaccharide biosynthesis protein
MASLLWWDAYRQKNWIKRYLRPSWIVAKRLLPQFRLLAARAAMRLAPFPSIDPDRLYPPRTVCESTREWVSKADRKFGAIFRDVDTSCTISYQPPKTVHRSIRQQFLIKHDWCETFVTNFRGGRATRRGFVITPDDQFLNDASIYFSAPRKNVAVALSQDWKLEPLTDVDARVAVLATEAAELYYHWLFQLLPRYELIRRAGISLNDIEYFYVNSQRSRFQRETLALLGIESSKIIDGDKVPYLRARELIVPSVPLGTSCFRPWMIDFLRERFLPKSGRDLASSGRRLYISRGLAEYRRVLNEGEVISVLKKHGFEVAAMETMSVPEQASVMAECDIVIGPHGGGMSNLVFCSPGTKVVEIYSPELVATYFWRLSNQLGLDYYYMLGEGSPVTLEADYKQSWDSREDIRVDVDVLRQTLALAGIGSE